MIKAHAGAGKSVILHRLAWDAAREYECICLFAKTHGSLNAVPLQEIIKSLQRRLYLFVDDAADRSRELGTLLSRMGPEGDYLTVIMAERINEWNVQGQDAAPYITDEYELKYLNAAEIDALLTLLERHHALGTHLESLSLDERRKELSEHAGRIQSHNAFRGTTTIPDSVRAESPQRARAGGPCRKGARDTL